MRTEPLRSEFGFSRTECACRLCQINCEHLPGLLVPSDLPRIVAALGYSDLCQFAAENLLASPGWLLGRRQLDGAVQTVRIPTLVPARAPSGHCKFLKDGRCTIHAVAPYGCAMLDAHMSRRECDRRSLAAARAVAADFAGGGDYARLWAHLKAMGREAPPAESSRRSLLAAARKEGLI